MAITAIEYSIFRSLRERNALPLGGDVLELGQANWYGDVDINLLAQDIYGFAPEASRQDTFRRLDEIVKAKREGIMWEIAEVYWSTMLQPRSMTAIDFHGTEQALKLDLNAPVDLERQYHLVMNLGTAEHVFNVAQVFKTIHDHTLPGGLMMHGMPFSGWIDHGFFNFNSTFYWDLSGANDYTLLLAIYAELTPLKLVQLQNRESILEMAQKGEIGENSLIYIVFRKQMQETEFRIPMQGVYAGNISEEAGKLWATLR